MIPICARRDTPSGVSPHLCSSIRHIFNEDSVAGCRVVDEDMDEMSKFVLSQSTIL